MEYYFGRVVESSSLNVSLLAESSNIVVSGRLRLEEFSTKQQGL